jgi:hypothetical protein
MRIRSADHARKLRTLFEELLAKMEERWMALIITFKDGDQRSGEGKDEVVPPQST